MQIVQRIFQLLKEYNADQKDLANILGIAPTTVSAWKKRNSDIPSSYISTIADFFDVSVDYLLTGKEAEKKIAPGLTEDEQKVLKYYGTLKEEQKDYIKGEMARLNMANRQDAEFAEEQAT